MRIAFRTQRLAKTFSSDATLKREFGKKVMVAVRRRMAVLELAPALSDVPSSKPERLHLLSGQRKGQFAVDLVHPYRLVFKPTSTPVPQREDGGIDRSKVDAVTILQVVDYH